MRAAADAVARAGVPVLIISGGYNQEQETACKAIARLTGGHHVIVRAPSHFLQQDNSEAFNGTVDTFMRNVECDRRDAESV